MIPREQYWDWILMFSMWWQLDHHKSIFRKMGYFENSPLGTECDGFVYPPVSEASREVANLNERKNPHTPVFGVKEFVCLSVCVTLLDFRS